MFARAENRRHEGRSRGQKEKGLDALALRADTTEDGRGTRTFQLALARRRLGEINLGAGRLAQLVERLLYTQDVGGSSPSPPTNHGVPGKLVNSSTAECPRRAMPGWTSVQRRKRLKVVKPFFG